MGHRDLNALDFDRTAFVYAHCILNALCFEPSSQLHDSNDRRFSGLRDIDSVSDMIKVAVGGKHEVELVDLLEVIWAGRVAPCPGVDHNSFAARRGEFESSMPEPGDLHALHIHVVTGHDVTNW